MIFVFSRSILVDESQYMFLYHYTSILCVK